MFESKDKITIIKNCYPCDSIQNKKIMEFISSPSLNGLIELEKFLKGTLSCSCHGDKMLLLFPFEVIPFLSTPLNLKDYEYASLILSLR